MKRAIECPNCNGTGIEKDSIPKCDGTYEDIEYPCPRCKGAKKITQIQVLKWVDKND